MPSLGYAAYSFKTVLFPFKLCSYITISTVKYVVISLTFLLLAFKQPFYNKKSCGWDLHFVDFLREAVGICHEIAYI